MNDVTEPIREGSVPNLVNHRTMVLAMLVEKLGGDVFPSDVETVQFERRQTLTMHRELNGIRVTLTPDVSFEG